MDLLINATTQPETIFLMACVGGAMLFAKYCM